MEVPKLPPAEVPSARAGTAALTEQGSQSPASIAPMLDRADIRPLDVPAALQILLAEVRAELDLTLDAAITEGSQGPITQGSQGASLQSPSLQSPSLQSPVQAARELVDMFLQELPEDATDAAAWTAALAAVETAMQSSMERAIDLVAVWQAVPAAVVDAVKETRTLFFSALGDESQNPLWLRPEWMDLGARLQHFRRRRRNARRRLIDPDQAPGSLDESEEFLR
jgi:hypothetical protein